MKRKNFADLLKISLISGILLANSVFANNINSTGHKSLIRTLTTETHGTTGMNVGLSIKADMDQGYSSGPNGSDRIYNGSQNAFYEEGLDQIYSGAVHYLFGLYRSWDLAVDLPFYHDKTSWDEDHSTLGRLGFSTKLSYPFDQDKYVLNHAYYLRIEVPFVGEKGSGFYPRHAYYIKEQENAKDIYSSSDFVIQPMMVWSFYFDRLKNNLPLRVHANIGGAIHSSGAAIAALGVEYRPVDGLQLFLEISGESRVIHYLSDFTFTSFDNDIFLITPGLRYTMKNGMYANLAFDFGISDENKRSEWLERGFEYSTRGAPRFGVQLSLGWAGLRKDSDSDKDGIKNVNDKCPEEKEDKDGFQDDDGCPDIDNDQDGVLDKADHCPMIKAVADGCPVDDTDGDGLADKKDKCPSKKEDFDKFEDEDGCPDVDNDGDQVYDDKDKCPTQSEDMDGYQDDDGCPELDNDGDGVVDKSDNCPNQKGTVADKGCPEKQTFEKGQLVLLNVSFEPGQAVFTANSYTILDYMVKSLEKWKEVKLEIQGHTDNVGEEKRNKTLSEARAKSVMDYFISKGVTKDRLKATGFGESNPIADNNTALGRAKNRRVVLKRID